MSSIDIQKIDITKLHADAIVNAANEGLKMGGGVCGAIFKAAGPHRLQKACDQIGYCPTGSVVITPAFDLPATYIIHAVGPRWTDGEHGEPELLRNVYTKALEFAVKNGCHSIGFPLISSGIFGYPLEKAWQDAINACCSFLWKYEKADIKVIFAVRSDNVFAVGEKELKSYAPDLSALPAKKGDWKTLDMPAENETFVLQRSFSEEQMTALRKGNIPEEMEDKWFWYMEGNTLYAHRSWTGFCVYIIEFSPDGNNKVTVNRDSSQYTCTSVDEDRKTLNELLNWWSGAPYDYYHEWLSEPVNALKKQGVMKDKLRYGNKEVEAVFFHKPSEPFGFLSNWYPSPFDLDGVHFSSAEQYIMYQKCMIFGDEESANRILSTEDTKEQQNIGRDAKGYVSKIWAGVRQMVALRALMGKFEQNEDLKQKLLDTGDAFLVECARTDKIWACGIRLDDDKRFNAANWDGENILGFALMEVRRRLAAE